MGSVWLWCRLLVCSLRGRFRRRGAEPEAKAVAAASNCKPGKIEVMRQIPGGNGEIVYKVTCADYKEMYVLVQCRQRLCILLR